MSGLNEQSDQKINLHSRYDGGTQFNEGNIGNMNSSFMRESMVGGINCEKPCTIKNCRSPPTHRCSVCNGFYCEKHVEEQHSNMNCDEHIAPIHDYYKNYCLCKGEKCSNQANQFCEFCLIPHCNNCSQYHSNTHQGFSHPILKMPQFLKNDLMMRVELTKRKFDELRAFRNCLEDKISEANKNYDDINAELCKHYDSIIEAALAAKKKESDKLQTEKLQYIKQLTKEYDEIYMLLGNYENASTTVMNIEEQPLELQWSNCNTMRNQLQPFFDNNHTFNPLQFQTVKFKKNDSLSYAVEHAAGVVITLPSVCDLKYISEAIPEPYSPKMISELTTCKIDNLPYIGMVDSKPCCHNCDHRSPHFTLFSAHTNNAAITLETQGKLTDKLADYVQQKRRTLFEDASKTIKALEFLESNVMAIISKINRTAIDHFVNQKVEHSKIFSSSICIWEKEFKRKTDIFMELKNMQRKLSEIEKIKKNNAAYVLLTQQYVLQAEKLQKGGQLEQNLKLETPELIRDLYNLNSNAIFELIQKSCYKINSKVFLWQEISSILTSKPQEWKETQKQREVLQISDLGHPVASNLSIQAATKYPALDGENLLPRADSMCEKPILCDSLPPPNMVQSTLFKGSNVTQEIVKRIEIAKISWKLDLHNIQLSIGDTFHIIPEMKNLFNLKELNMRKCNLDDTIFSAIAPSIPTGVEVLDFADNNLMDLTHLIHGLSEHKSLRKVDISKNNITSKVFSSLLQLLAKNCSSTLLELSANSNQIDDSCITELCSHLENFTAMHNRKGKITINRNKISSSARQTLKSTAERLQITLII